MKKEFSSSSGFTLWELLLVLSLMGVFLASLTPHFASSPNQVRVRMDHANVVKIEGAAQLYRIDVGTFPTSVADLVDSPPGVSGWRGPYLRLIPEDPFNSAESYQFDSLGRVKTRTSKE